MPDRKPIVFVTTADTDILAADQALSGLPGDFPLVHAFNPGPKPAKAFSVGITPVITATSSAPNATKS